MYGGAIRDAVVDPWSQQVKRNSQYENWLSGCPESNQHHNVSPNTCLTSHSCYALGFFELENQDSDVNSQGNFIYICYSLAGESILGETRPMAALSPRARFLPIWTDLGQWITFLFVFLLRFKSFRKILLQPPTYLCWRRARSCWCPKRTIDCKPKQNITTWFLNS